MRRVRARGMPGSRIRRVETQPGPPRSSWRSGIWPAWLPRDTRVRRVPMLPSHDLAERTTTSEGIRLVPLETLDARGYRPIDDGVRPPWQKDAYWDPESDES